jgi:hypothetical protein
MTGYETRWQTIIADSVADRLSGHPQSEWQSGDRRPLPPCPTTGPTKKLDDRLHADRRNFYKVEKWSRGVKAQI